MNNKRFYIIVAVILAVLLSFVGCKRDSFTAQGVTNLSSLHLSDLGGTATPVLRVDQTGPGALLELLDGGTPAVSVYDGGNVAIVNDLDVDGTLNMDAIDIDGALQLDNTLTVGVEGTAFDVIFYSDTSGDYLHWDQSAEALIITGTAAATALDVADGNVSITDDLAVDGTTNLDDVDIDLTASMNIDGHMLDVGTGTCGVADGDNDVCIADVLEVDGEAEFDGAIDADSTSDFADTATFSKAAGNAIVVTAGGAIDANGGVDIAGALTLDQVNGAAASANPIDWTGTTGIMDGSDTLEVIDINLTSANHTSTSNVINGVSLTIGSEDADAEESAIYVSSGWDNDLNAQTSLELAVDDAVIVVIADPPAANASGDLVDITATNLGGDGSDVFKGIDLNLTGTAGSSTNTTTGIELGLTTPQGTQTETGLALIDKNWDVGIDLGGNCLDLDDAATTSICADTDNTIDIEVGGADDFQITANTLSVLSGSTLTIDDGASVSVVATNGAGASANPWDYTATAGIMDGSDTLEIIDINMTGANHTGASNVVTGISIDLTTVDPQVPEKAIDIDDTDFDYAIDAGAAVILNTAQTIFIDFYGDALPGELVLLNGNDAEAVDPAIVANEQYGVVTLVSGDVGDTCANDCSELGFGTVYKADQGNLVFEIRLHIDTGVTNASVCAGFTDVATIELPAKATGGGDGITAIADNAIAICFDDAATTKEWFSFGIDGTTQATGNSMVGVGPTHSVYQVLRIEVDAGGEDARFYIDGALVDTLTANVVLITADLMPFVGVDSNTTASVTIDVDYIFVSANRN